MHADGCAKPEQTRLIWLNKIGEPPGHADHNIGYDEDVVQICPACNGATIERLRHDCFDFESVYDQYEWYELTPEDGARLREVAARCDRPLDPFCGCAVHKGLKSSAMALPSSSWDSIFEERAHRHVVSLKDGPKPVFVLVTRGEPSPPGAATPQAAAAPAETKPLDTATIVFVALAWPLTFGAMLTAWFWFVDWPFLADAIVVVVALPVSFVLAGLVSAAVAVTIEGKKPEEKRP